MTLAEAVRLGIAYHPSITFTEAERSAASAVLGEVKAKRIPTVSAEASLTHFQEPMIIAPLHGFDPNIPPQFDETLVQSRVIAGYTLFDGGKRGARVDRARAGLAATDASAVSARMATIQQISLAFLRVLTARGIDEAAERRIDALDAERSRVSRLLQEGRAAQVELLRVEAELSSALADQIATRTRVETSGRRLARLIGAPWGDVVPSRLVAVGVAESGAPEVPEAFIQQATSANPALEAARQRAQAEQAGRRAARAAWLPDLRVTGGYVVFGSASGNFQGEWQAGVGLSYPRFTGGERSSAVSEADARARAAEARLQLLELETETTVDEAVAAVRESRARTEALVRTVEHLTEVARIERIALDAGAGVQTDFLEAEATLFQARANLVEARHAEIAARIALARAVGHLTSEWLVENVENAP
jgi:outer membrane protein